MCATQLTVVGLFSGIGGLESGLHRAGHQTVAACEIWEPARAVLAQRFPGLDVVTDVRTMRTLPAADLVAAGFPCTDFSPAGRTAGIAGDASGLVYEVLRLIAGARPRWVLLENVANMLHLRGGEAIVTIASRLAELGYDWAYRVVDSRSFGVPQRRRRVFLLAATDGDPAAVLFPDDAGARPAAQYETSAYGFSWTEGNRGLGWAQDAVPTLKGSTTTNVPSPPAVWLVGHQPGDAIVTPSIRTVEMLQGFDPDWTVAAPQRTRWKLVGNAVTVLVAEWLGRRLRDPEDVFDLLDVEELTLAAHRPAAACRRNGKTWRVPVSEWPVRPPYRHLREVLEQHGCAPLSLRATSGFRDRLRRSRLRYPPAFMAALDAHVDAFS